MMNRPRATCKKFSLLVKRVIDISASAVAISFFCIPMLVIALLVRIDSAGPILFRQTRIGLAGKPFVILKFRTMVEGSEEKLLEKLEQHGAQMSIFYKIQNDDRVTRIGKFLRVTSLDELPQFFNIFAGQMSLVGPRPHVQGEVELYSQSDALRLTVKPGLTGLWQVAGRSELSAEEGLRLDLNYVENWTLGLDMRILLRTFKTVLSRTGAF